MPLGKRVYKRCGVYATKYDFARTCFDTGKEDEENTMKFAAYAMETILYQGQRTGRTTGEAMDGSFKAPKPLFCHVKRVCQVSIISIVNNVKESTRKMREPMFEGIMSYYSYTNITVRGRQKYYPLAQARAVARSSARSAVVQISKTPPNMLPSILPALSIKRGLG
jgi:hypothetical protein